MNQKWNWKHWWCLLVCGSGGRELCAPPAGGRAHRLPEERPGCKRTWSPQHHGNYSQQVGSSHHQRDPEDLRCSLWVHVKHDQQGLQRINALSSVLLETLLTSALFWFSPLLSELWRIPGAPNSFLLPAPSCHLPVFPSLSGHCSSPVQTDSGLHHLGFQAHHEERGWHR